MGFSEKPSVSDLRIILLGKSLSDTGSVGNCILGTTAFETEGSRHSVSLQCGRVRGHVKGRSITIVNAPHLFQQTLSSHQLTQCLKECVSLSVPGPHVIMLIVQPEDFTEADKKRVDRILSDLSEDAHNYTMVLTTKNIEMSTSVDQDQETVLQEIIAKCNYRHLNFSGCSQDALVKKMEEMVKVNKGNLICEVYEEADSAVDQKPSEQFRGQLENQETVTLGEHTKPKKQGKSGPAGIKSAFNIFKGGLNVRKKEHSELKHLNLVLLGMEELMASVSKILLGKKSSLFQSESSSECVVRKGEVCGHLITLVEMPALYNTRLSEQEVMRLTRHCVSVCDPGVHVFFIMVPEGLSNEDKAEIKMIQRVFGSRINDHVIFLINQQSQKEQIDQTLQSVIKTYGGRSRFYSSKTKADDLFICVKNLLKNNNNRPYTMAMYADAQVETQLQYKREIETLQQQVTELKTRTQTEDLSKSPDALRIVLLGKTGVGKSASGNTILGKNVFKEIMSLQSVTTACQKETVELGGRRITVIDTPGLFDTNTDNEESKKEIVKCISMAAPGPHVFLLVLKIGQRFTQEERDAVKFIEKTFGIKSNTYTIILFTCGDLLNEQPFEQFIQTAAPELNKLLLACGKRYQVFSNSDNCSNTQVSELLDKIDSMVKVNGGGCYTNQMFQEVEETLEKEKERILKEREEQIEREKEELKTKHEAEMEDMRREMQKQKERQEAEERRKEEDFKRREEQMKKDMEKREQQVREDFQKRKDDDTKMKEWMQQINREREENKKQWESQRQEDQKRRDQEEEERRRREQEWKEQQRAENEKFQKEKEEMKIQKEKELKKLQQEYKQKAAEEDRRRRDLEETIKDAEESKKKELRDLQLSQQREWEQRMKVEEKKRNKEQEVWEERIAAMDKWSLEQIRKQRQYEQERQKEKEERDLREKKRKEKEEQERKRIENDFNEKIRNMEEQLKAKREKDERERKEKAEELKKEMEEKLRTQQEDFRKEKEEEERKHKEEEERNLAFITEQHKKELETQKAQTEAAARKQAEEEFKAQLDEKVKQAEEKFEAKLDAEVKEAKRKGFEEGRAHVESERTRPGRAMDGFINYFY